MFILIAAVLKKIPSRVTGSIQVYMGQNKN